MGRAKRGYAPFSKFFQERCAGFKRSEGKEAEKQTAQAKQKQHFPLCDLLAFTTINPDRLQAPPRRENFSACLAAKMAALPLLIVSKLAISSGYIFFKHMAHYLLNMAQGRNFQNENSGPIKGANMDIQFRSRNQDMGAYFPTFQERVNSMLPADKTAASAAPALEPEDRMATTPHLPTEDEIMQTLAQVEQEAANQSEQLIQIHSGLNEQRVARLLGLLD